MIYSFILFSSVSGLHFDYTFTLYFSPRCVRLILCYTFTNTFLLTVSCLYFSYTFLPSVSGLYFANPQSNYFSLGKIQKDQVNNIRKNRVITCSMFRWWTTLQGRVKANRSNADGGLGLNL